MYCSSRRALGTRPFTPTVGMGATMPIAASTADGWAVSAASSATAASCAFSSDCCFCKSARTVAAESAAILASAADFADAASTTWMSAIAWRKSRICPEACTAITR